MKPKTETFIREIEDLCMKYGFQIASSGYDSLQVWNTEGDKTLINFSSIEDKTNG